MIHLKGSIRLENPFCIAWQKLSIYTLYLFGLKVTFQAKPEGGGGNLHRDSQASQPTLPISGQIDAPWEESRSSNRKCQDIEKQWGRCYDSRNDGTEQFEREKTQRNMKLNKEVWSHEQPQQNQNPFSLLHLITSLMFSQVCFKDTYVCYWEWITDPHKNILSVERRQILKQRMMLWKSYLWISLHVFKLYFLQI